MTRICPALALRCDSTVPDIYYFYLSGVFLNLEIRSVPEENQKLRASLFDERLLTRGHVGLPVDTGLT